MSESARAELAQRVGHSLSEFIDDDAPLNEHFYVMGAEHVLKKFGLVEQASRKVETPTDLAGVCASAATRFDHVLDGELANPRRLSRGEWIAEAVAEAGYRKVEAAPSDTDEHGNDWSGWQAGDDGPSCRCGYNGTPDDCARSRSSQPVQVEAFVAKMREFEKQASHADPYDPERERWWKVFANIAESHFIGGEGCVIAAFDERLPTILPMLGGPFTESEQSDG